MQAPQLSKPLRNTREHAKLFGDAKRNRHVCGRKRKVDGEDAAFTRNVVNVDVSTVCSDRLSSNRKPQAKACSISAPPLAERLKRVACRGRNAAALVFDLY